MIQTERINEINREPNGEFRTQETKSGNASQDTASAQLILSDGADMSPTEGDSGNQNFCRYNSCRDSSTTESKYENNEQHLKLRCITKD